MSETKINFLHKSNKYDCTCYIRSDEGGVTSIILYTILSLDDGDIWLGAYYGDVGGGEADGGYFRILIEEGESMHLDFDDIDLLSQENPSQASLLESIMQTLWTLVEDDEGPLILTELGGRYFEAAEDGVWMDESFDGDSLDEISDQWKIGLTFEG